MDLQKVPIHELEPAGYNPRVDLKPGDLAYESLKRSIETFGCLQPIIVNQRTRHVVGGHQRLKVLKDLGYTEAEVVVVDLSIAQEKTLNLTLNKTGGDWDPSKLAALLQEIEGFPEVDIRLTGFDDDEIGDLISRMLDSDAPGGQDDDFDLQAALESSLEKCRGEEPTGRCAVMEQLSPSPRHTGVRGKNRQENEKISED